MSVLIDVPVTCRAPRTFADEVARLVPDLQRRARSLCRAAADADDLVQETVLRALRFQRTFKPNSNLRAWVMRILHNTFISTQRRRGVERRVLERTVHDSNAWISSPRSEPMLRLRPSLERALSELPAPIGATLRLVDLDDASYKEAAEALNVPIGTVMSRLHRGRQRLAAALSA